ncbi:MAG: hypothetical protein R2932_00510 [Caldilineaceae bacterium]
MITPFEEKLVRQGVISYGLSSFGYDIRVADEFLIFTTATGQLTVVDPKAIDEKVWCVTAEKSALFHPMVLP